MMAVISRSLSPLKVALTGYLISLQYSTTSSCLFPDNPNYEFPSMVNLKDETHGGDDVAVFARGPWAHLLVGNYEQTLIPHVISYAAGIGPLKNKQMPSSGVAATPAVLLVLLLASCLPSILH